MHELSTELLLQAYQLGIFPMAHPEEGNAIYWYAPDPRTILPLTGFHVPHSLDRVVKQGRFTVVSDRDFTGVMRACAAPRAESPGVWISEEFIRAYTELHRLGYAHSVECWEHDQLVGGLYGVAIGGAFFGESMFHLARDASKVALVHLVAHLQRRGYRLLDVQFTTPHLRRFGVTEIPRRDYERLVARAVKIKTSWGW